MRRAPISTQRLARRAARRALVADWLGTLGRALVLACSISLMIVAADKLMRWQLDWRWVLASLTALGVVGSALWAWRTRPSELQAAQTLDRALGLEDRLSSGLELADQVDSPFAAMAVQQAERAAQEVSPKVATPIRLGRSWLVWPVVMAAAVLVAVLVPMAALQTQPDQTSPRQSQQQLAAALDEVIESARATPQPSQPPDQAKPDELRAIEQIRDQLESGAASPAQARVRAADAVDTLADRLEHQAQIDQERTDLLRETLAESASQIPPTDARVDDLIEALGQGDFDAALDAADQLADQLDAMSPDQRARAAEALDGLADRLAGASQPSEPSEVGPVDQPDTQASSEPAPDPEQRADPDEPMPDRDDLARSLREQGMDPVDAQRVADRMVREQLREQAEREAARDAQDLHDALREAADQLRDPPADTQPPANDQPPADQQPADSPKPDSGSPDATKPTPIERTSPDERPGDTPDAKQDSAPEHTQDQSSPNQPKPDQPKPDQGAPDQSTQRPEPSDQSTQDQPSTEPSTEPSSKPGTEPSTEPSSKPSSKPGTEPGTSDQPSPEASKPDQATPNQTKPDQAEPDQSKPDQSKPDSPAAEPSDQPNADQPGPEQSSPDQSSPDQSPQAEPSPQPAKPTGQPDRVPSDQPGETPSTQPPARPSDQPTPDSPTPQTPDTKPTQTPDQPSDESQRTPDRVGSPDQPSATDQPSAPTSPDTTDQQPATQPADSDTPSPRPGNPDTQPGRERLESLRERLDDLAQRRSQQQTDRQRARQLRQQRDELLEGLTPDQRDALDQQAQPAAPAPRPADAPADPDAIMDQPTDRMDLPRATGDETIRQRVLAEWDAPPRAGQVPATGDTTADAPIRQAVRGAKQAIEQQRVPRRYRSLIQRVYDRLDSRTRRAPEPDRSP